jgi:hypothetical protein
MTNLRASVLAIAMLAPAAARAGVTITYDTKDQAGKAGTAIMVFQGDRLRIEGGTQREHTGAAIIDAAARKMLMIDTSKREYHELTAADFKQMQERMAQARAMMANMPPEARKRMEQMMPGGGAGLVPKYDPMGQKKTVAGYACEMYRVSMGEQVISESCIAPWTANIFTKAEVQHLKDMAAQMKELFDFSKQMDFSKVPGIPVEEYHLGPDGKTRTYTRTLKTVTRADVPASMFEVPAGFTKRANPMMGGHR